MDSKDNYIELLKFANENSENKKKVINQALQMITLLNEVGDKKLTEKELNDISGGGADGMFCTIGYSS